MLTPLGTPYPVLRRLALHGACPSRWDCETCEREARALHARKVRNQALQMLLIARALWSAYRQGHSS